MCAVGPTDQPGRGRFALAIVLALFLAAAAVATLTYASTPEAKAAGGSGWQVSGAPFRVGLTISDSQLGSTLEEFPLKVVLTPQNFDYAGAASDGVAADASSADLAFVLAGDAGDTQLPYQVDTWKPGGTSVVWVRIPSLSGNAQLLELYYGAGGTYDGPTPAAVWTGGYTSVNEFTPEFGSGLTAPTLPDPLPTPPQAPSAAGAGLPGLPNGTVFPDLVGGTATQATLANDGAEGAADYSNAVIGDAGSATGGQAVQLSGGTSSKKGTYLTLPSAIGDNDGVQTLSTTVYIPQSALTAAAASGNPAAGLLGQHVGATGVAVGTAPGSGGTGAIFMALANACIYVPVYYGPGATYSTVSDCGASGNATGGSVEPGTTPVTAGWHTLDVVLNGTSETLYIDGAQLATHTMPEPVDKEPTSPFIMGQYSNSATSGQGSTAFGFDQLTFSDVARSSDWVQAEYASQTNELITFGSRQDITTPTGVTVSGSETTATLAWDAVEGATEYLVYEGSTAGGEGTTPVATVTSPTAQITGLASATHHYFTVATVTATSTSAPSDEVEYVWAQAPSGLGGTAFHDGSTVQLRWSAPADATPSTSYLVYAGTSPGGEESTPVECVGLGATSCLATGLNTNTTYYFTVAAKTAGATSEPSPETTTKTAPSNTSGQAWQLSGAEYRLPMEVGDPTLVEKLEDFPVKVVLTPKNFDYAGAAADGVAADATPNDLAFVLAADANSSPVQLPYQVDTWKPGATSILWVLLPQFEGNVTLNNLELYYGGSAEYAGPNARGTWSNGYQVVNQMTPSFEGVTAPSLADPLPAPPQGPAAAGEGAAGLPTGSTFGNVIGGPEEASILENNGATEGSVFSNEVLGEAGAENAGGQALQLSGSTGGSIAGGAAGTGGTYLSMPASTGANDGIETLSTTVYFPQSAIEQVPNGGAAAAILGQHYQSLTVTPPGIEQGSGGTGAIFMALSNKCVYVPVYYGPGVTYSTVGTCGANATGGAPGAGQAPITVGWHTLDVVLNGTSEALYIDGVLRSTNTMPQPVDADPTSPFILGEYSDVKQGNASAYGYDQLSVADVARSSSWIQAEYQSQQNQVIEYGTSASVSTPTGVTASGSGDSVTISWGAVSGATGYKVFEGNAPGAEGSTPIACSTETATSCTVTNLASGVDYFTVAAVTASGTSLPSAEVSYTYLTPPTAVSAEAISDTSVAIEWSAVTGASTYSVYEGTTAGGEGASSVTCKALTPTSCLVSGLTEGDTYYFDVSADRGSFTSVASTAEDSATPGSQSAWAVPAAQERIAVTLEAAALGSDLSDFPVQVQLPTSFDYTNAAQGDLVFTRGADPTPLPYEVESWNPGGVSTIWVRIPTLAPADPPLYMYYDGTPATSTAAAEVWGPGFVGVYHFGDAAGSTTVTDSTTHGNDGTIAYGAAGAGAVAFQQEGQDGSPSMTEMKENEAEVSFGTLGEGLTEFTYSASVGIDSPDAGLGELVLAGRNASGNTQPGEQFSLLTESNEWVPTIESGTDPTVESSSTYQGDKPSPTQTACTSPVNYPASGWNFYDLTMTYDGSALRFFVDGEEACDVPFAGPLEPGELPFTIGMATPGGTKPEGTQWGDWNWDEMRLSDVARSSDWVTAEHLAQAGELTHTGSPQADFKTTGASIDGTPRIGNTLTADTGGFSPPATVYGYQWFDNGNPISGATSPTLDLTSSLLGAGIAIGDQITVQITGTDDGITLSPTSASVTVALGEFGAGTPTISGPAKVGATLNANAGKWTPAGTSAYRWLRNGAPIAGATSAAYSPVVADEGKSISVEVTESATGYADDTVTSAPVTVAVVEAPAVEPTPVVGTPAIAGTVRVGETVTAAPGEWSPAATPSYQWFLDGAPIAGATGSSYVVAGGDAGHQLSVEVTEAPAGVGPETGLSAAYEVQPGSFLPGTPAIDGTAAVGSTLSASAGDWRPTPALVNYQWLRDGQPIAGATSSTYAVTAGDAGHQISVTVRVSSPGLLPESVTAPGVSIPTPAPAAPAEGTTTKKAPGGSQSAGRLKLSIVKAPRIVGAHRVGGKLTASTGTWSIKPASVTYQWLRDGKAIPGATHPSLKLTRADAGATLSVRVTASVPGSGKVTVTSAKVRLPS